MFLPRPRRQGRLCGRTGAAGGAAPCRIWWSRGGVTRWNLLARPTSRSPAALSQPSLIAPVAGAGRRMVPGFLPEIVVVLYLTRQCQTPLWRGTSSPQTVPTVLSDAVDLAPNLVKVLCLMYSRYHRTLVPGLRLRRVMGGVDEGDGHGHQHHKEKQPQQPGRRGRAALRRWAGRAITPIPVLVLPFGIFWTRWLHITVFLRPGGGTRGRRTPRLPPLRPE